MANLWLDLKGPILADTVYVDGVLAAKDVTIGRLQGDGNLHGAAARPD